MKGGSKDAESLTEEERRALRGSRFSSSLPPPSAAPTKPRMAHPGGPVATNKAAALAKFLERKLQEPGGLTSIDSLLVESAVRHAKDTLKASSSKSGHMIKHITSFAEDGEGSGKSEDVEIGKSKKKKKKKKVRTSYYSTNIGLGNKFADSSHDDSWNSRLRSANDKRRAHKAK